jgi:isopropylmalate/homocitrate/citramalate synthase
MTTALPSRVRIVEVGPRDGLQNEAVEIPTAAKVAFVEALVAAGLREIEVTSFVRPDPIPQLADAEAVVEALPEAAGVTFCALVPNDVGLRRAIDAGIGRIAVFTAASESFSRHNIGMSIAESLEVFERVVTDARAAGLTVGGYVSTCFVCPYEGEVDPERVREVTSALIDMGVDRVGVSDTIGAAAPSDVERTVAQLLETVAPKRIALHLHDTYGTALANVYAGLRMGIETFDASAGGLGGCPYAPGAAGNLATEDLVYMLDRLGIESGVDLVKLYAATRGIAGVLDHDLPGKQYQRLRTLEAAGWPPGDYAPSAS